MQTVPHVTIITPSLNQAHFIEDTIQSVLSQDYFSLEHIVIDGGSTDGTLDILEKYRQTDLRFRYISEPDNGQSEAINKGLNLAKGDIIGWLNSDDTYCQNAVSNAVKAFEQHPEWTVVYGKAFIINEKNEIIRSYPVRPFTMNQLFHSCFICQPAAFIKKKAFDRAGGVNEHLDFCMDYDLWIRMAKRKETFGFLNKYLANTRFYANSKTGAKLFDAGFPEIIETLKQHFGAVSKQWILFFLNHFRHKGSYQFLYLFKKYSLLGKSSKVHLSKKVDYLPSFSATINSNPSEPVQAILFKGELKKFRTCRIEIVHNGKTVYHSTIRKGSFELVIPLFIKNREIIEVKLKRPHDQYYAGETIFRLDHLLPLSKKEWEFYQNFEKGAREITKWVHQHFPDAHFQEKDENT